MNAGSPGGSVDLVFEGGGVRGIALVGAYSVLEERGYRPENMAGASAGTIVAALAAAGYTAPELREIVLGLDYDALRDKGWEDRLPLLPRAVSIFKDRGLYEGDALLELVRELLEARGVRSFGDLVRRPDAEPRYRHRLQVIVSDLTERRLLVLPRDAGRLGVEDPDELGVALAVRASAGIPIFFEPVVFRNPKTGRDHLLVDGGILSNFPVWLFDAEDPIWPTIGLKLVEEDPRAPLGAYEPRNEELSIVGYLESLVETVLEAHDRFYIETTDFERNIAINTLGVGVTEFGLSRERALALYESGRAAAERFLPSASSASSTSAP